MVSEKVKERFWSKAEKVPGGCWEWQAGIDGNGYGLFWHPEKRRNTGAHRMSFEIHNGFPPGNMFVMHSCDNRLCVNPEHLSLGTLQDNVDDMVNKGRNFRGSHNKKECIHGHPMTKENTYVYHRRGVRNTACRTCRREAVKKYSCTQ